MYYYLFPGHMRRFCEKVCALFNLMSANDTRLPLLGLCNEFRVVSMGFYHALVFVCVCACVCVCVCVCVYQHVKGKGSLGDVGLFDLLNQIYDTIQLV
jgi:hypothetical protein